MVPFVGGRQTKKPKLLLSHPPSLLNEWLDRWRSEWGGTRSAESENSFFYLERKRIFQDLVEVKQHFKDFEDFVRVKRAGTRQAECFVLF